MAQLEDLKKQFDNFVSEQKGKSIDGKILDSELASKKKQRDDLDIEIASRKERLKNINDEFNKKQAELIASLTQRSQDTAEREKASLKLLDDARHEKNKVATERQVVLNDRDSVEVEKRKLAGLSQKAKDFVEALQKISA